MALEVYVLFENNAPMGDPGRPQYRHEEPKAVLIEKPTLTHGIDYIRAELYNDIDHQRVSCDIGRLSQSQLEAKGLTPEIIKERLTKAFGQAAIDGTGLPGQKAYVIMERVNQDENALFPQLRPVKVVFLRATHLAGTHNPLTSTYVPVYTSLDEMNAAKCAAKFKDEATLRLSYRTRKVLGLE